jgi:hypothetical protein
MLVHPDAAFGLAQRVRSPEGAPLGEVFSFLSGLYFRGKIAYAHRFARPPGVLPAALVITPDRGLLPPDTPIGADDLSRFAAVAIDLSDPRYSRPLELHVRRLADAAPAHCSFVLLGSIATSKYLELLLSSLGDRLCFPEPFLGMGDMQRGALLLRSAEQGVELPYTRAAGAVRSLAARRPGRVT